MHTIGRINRDIYQCISNDIMTDEVILTERQLNHIKDRHPEVYNELKLYIKEALQDPDYILEDKHANTGLVVKRIMGLDEWEQIVLRLCTSKDEPGYKNSIISYWKISDKRLQSYLRNKKVLYKKEYSE